MACNINSIKTDETGINAPISRTPRIQNISKNQNVYPHKELFCPICYGLLCISVTRYTLISQSWRLKSWPAGHFAEVTMQITPTKDGAKLNVTLKGVPTKELIPTRDCWQRYYFHAIKQFTPTLHLPTVSSFR